MDNRQSTGKQTMNQKSSLLKKLSERHVIVFTVLFWVIQIIVVYAGIIFQSDGRFYRFIIPDTVLYWSNYTAQYFVATILNIVISLLFLLFAYKVDTVHDIGLYSAKGILKSLLLGLPIISVWIFYALAYASIWRVRTMPKWYQVAIALIYLLTVGLSEELAFRGVLLPVLLKSWRNKKHGIVYAVLLSSAAFGSVHYIQHYVAHDVLPMAVMHVITTIMGGMFLAAVLLHTRNIWGAIIVHALWDLFDVLAVLVCPQIYIGNMSTTREVNKLLGTSFEVRGRTDWIFNLIFMLPVLAAAIIYLRKIVKNQDD